MNNNLKKYQDAFVSTLDAIPEELDETYVFGSHSWDSMGHMMLIAAIEDEFDIMLEPDDIMHFGSYENGKSVLAKYGIEM